MRPTDPRLRPHLAPARLPLAGVMVAGVAGAVLIITQAWFVTGLVVATVRDEPLTRWVATGRVPVPMSTPRTDERGTSSR